MAKNVVKYLLDKSISTATPLFFLLQLNKLKLTEGFEDILQVTFSDAEMYVPNIQPMEWNLIRIGRGRLRISSLAVFLRFGKLSNDGDS